MNSFLSVATAAGLLAMVSIGTAEYSAGSTKNIAVYWGQNSINQVNGQQRLSYYCDATSLSVISISFMNGISPAITNFANAGDNCTTFSDNANLLNCPQIAADILSCQSRGKTITLSLGGATYSQGGWPSSAAAEAAAQSVWDMFGPVGKNVNRPFGSAVVNGFDFDFESSTSNLPAFGAKLRSLMDGAGGRYYLSAAPQCVFPDANVGDVLNAVAFDFVSIQFYNNGCGVEKFVENSSTQNAYNFDVWNNWARGSKNPKVKLLVGVPAATGAAGGYSHGSQLKAAISWSQKYSNFGGVMMWDMSQLWANNGFLNEVVSDMNGAPSSATTTISISSGSSATTGVAGRPEWAQCGGQGYTGPTICAAPYKCVSSGIWWSSCR